MDVRIGEPVDTFGGAGGEANARSFDVSGHAFFARKPIEADAVLDAPGMACISLTPLVKTTIRGMSTGAVLEVRTDDPAAREGIPSWCRLTKNTLLDSVEHDAVRTTFSIQHTPNNTKADSS